MRNSSRWDWVMAGTLTLLGALLRTPYLALVPVFDDEVMETVYALSIRPGKFLPLVGVDAYTGAFFSYLVAGFLRFFGVTPIGPRILMLIMGALTVGLTFWLGRAVGLSRPWAALAGLLMAINPHHIAVNSHMASTSYAIPLFVTAFLVALVLAVRRQSGWMLVLAGLLLGLALQVNPIPALVLPGVFLWLVTRRSRIVSLRSPWPYLAGAACLLIYSPVIVYNTIEVPLAGIRELAQSRTYIWQPDPSLTSYLQNLGRLFMQLFWQVGGVLERSESLPAQVDPAFAMAIWSVAGLVYAARTRIGPEDERMTLPALAIGAQILAMPWLSNYYGSLGRARYTSQLMPLVFVAMATLAAGIFSRIQARHAHRTLNRLACGVAVISLVGLSFLMLMSLFRYYDNAMTRGPNNALAFAFRDEFMRQWRGEKVMVNDGLISFISFGDPSVYNPTVYLLSTSGVPYDALPLGQIFERLATGQESGRIILVLDNGDLDRARTQADLAAWDGPAIRAVAERYGYGVYTIADASRVRKPPFVFADAAAAPPVHPVHITFFDPRGAGIQLFVIGHRIEPRRLKHGHPLTVNVHWQAKAATEAYTGFVHLVGPDGQLAAQDDHELGRGFYRTFVWRPNEVIREKYVLTVPKDMPNGDYAVRVGAYSIPSFQRLKVESSSEPTQDNTVTLGMVQVEP